MAAVSVPLTPSERVEWVDALRGFALLGIVVANLQAIYYRRGPTGAVYALIYFFGTHVLALGCGAFGLAWLARGRALLCHLSPVGRTALSTTSRRPS